MPIYEYQCKNCTVFQVETRSIAERDNLPDCPGCGQQMFRQLDFGAIHFIGGGFYANDKKASEDTL